MSLDKQIEKARKEIAPDGYDMSVGELLNLYRDKELIIHPDYQRLFRWNHLQKTRFIESLLLGIPVPPIFVFQEESGKWELIDGLQRLSTIFQFVGVLRPRTGASHSSDRLILIGTNFLPGLDGKAWEGDSSGDGIGGAAQLFIKRARIRVEILKKESDPLAKYELFQRLNTGGSALTEQEVRNCTALMINAPFHEWLVERSTFAPFSKTTAQTKEALEKQSAVELVLRFLAFRHVKYQQGLDVHEYLDKALLMMASDKTFDLNREVLVFRRTFTLLSDSLGSRAFKKWDGRTFSGKFLQSLFEVIAIGVSHNIDQIEALGKEAAKRYVIKKAKELWSDQTFLRNSGAGVRGTTRLANLLPMAAKYFQP